MNWFKEDSEILLNPRLSQAWKSRIIQCISQMNLEGYVWVSSSGTESSGRGIKMVGIKKERFLDQAQKVCEFFNLDKNDRWLNTLPKFHVGGLSIEARCHISGANEIVLPQWDLENFEDLLKREKPTILSLVPTQVFDLVRAGFKAPLHLRIALVGGGALDEELYFRGRRLGWPLLPSYGMTETSAMVACAPISSLNAMIFPGMTALPGVQFEKLGKKWSIDAPGLFDHWMWINQNDFHIMDRAQPFFIDDLLNLENGLLRVSGRETELVKILGESVNLRALESQLSLDLGFRVALVAVPEQRKGFNLIVVADQVISDQLLDRINSERLPFERITSSFHIDGLPLTELGKLKRLTLREEILNSLS